MFWDSLLFIYLWLLSLLLFFTMNSCLIYTSLVPITNMVNKLISWQEKYLEQPLRVVQRAK